MKVGVATVWGRSQYLTQVVIQQRASGCVCMYIPFRPPIVGRLCILPGKWCTFTPCTLYCHLHAGALRLLTLTLPIAWPWNKGTAAVAELMEIWGAGARSST